jgi:hypothetical protein
MKRKDLSDIVTKQGERLVKLESEVETLKIKNEYANRKCLDLQGKLDDSIDERIEDLRKVVSHLTRNDYNNPRAKIAIALEFVEDKINELENADDIN